MSCILPSAPIVRDIGAYTQTGAKLVIDQRAVAEYRGTSFLTEEEERWYEAKLKELRSEFGLKPQDDNF